jgi:hypothetical protein
MKDVKGLTLMRILHGWENSIVDYDEGDWTITIRWKSRRHYLMMQDFDIARFLKELGYAVVIHKAKLGVIAESRVGRDGTVITTWTDYLRRYVDRQSRKQLKRCAA